MHRQPPIAACFALLLLGSPSLDAAPDVDLGGPTIEVQDLWTAATLDDEALAAAVDTLTAWFDRDGQHLLDQEVDYSFIESVALDDLRARDVVGLAEVGWDPLEQLGLDRAALDGRLAGARGLLATSAIDCSIDAVEARMQPKAALKLEAGTEDGVFAGQPLRSSVVSGTRTAELDVDGAITRAVLQLEVQTAPAEVAGGIELAQRWQLDLWLERDLASTLRLRSVWIEASSASFSPDSRTWMGWALHDAFEDAADWNRHCAAQPAGPTVPQKTKKTKKTKKTRDSAAVVSRPEVAEASTVQVDERSTPLPPLCEGVRLIEIEPWALRLEEIHHSSVSKRGSKDPEHVTVDQDGIDRWVERGVQNWAAALGVNRQTVTPDDEARLRRLVERFGHETRFLPPDSHARLHARWQKGLLREFLGQDPVLIPVCPAAIEHTATKLGYGTEEARRIKQDDIEAIAAVALLEQGSVLSVGEDEWAAIRSALAFGDALMNLFNSTDSAIDATPGSESKPDIDAVDSNL